MRSLNLLGQKYFLGPTFKKQRERERKEGRKQGRDGGAEGGKEEWGLTQ